MLQIMGRLRNFELTIEFLAEQGVISFPQIEEKGRLLLIFQQRLFTK